MHKGCWLVQVLYLVAVPTVFTSRLQLQIPKQDFLSYSLSEDDELDSSSVNPDHLREALLALLELNDGELTALLKGQTVSLFADNLSPSTEFIVRASKNLLEDLKKAEEYPEIKELHKNGFKIAKRKKTLNNKMLSEDILQLHEDRDKSDTLLGALAHLSAYLNENANRGKKDKKMKAKNKRRNRFHSSRKPRKIHHSYWLRPGECPMTKDGISKLLCPTPTTSGEWLCIEDEKLCDNQSHCPHHEDEDPKACLYYNGLRNHMEMLEYHILSSQRS